MISELSIIIPYGLSAKREYIRERVLEKVLFFYEFKLKNNIEIIFSEGFSDINDSELCNNIKDHGFVHIKDYEQKKFNLARCRNNGASASRSNVLLFLDVDYYIGDLELELILNEIRAYNIDKKQNKFLFIPCAFLTESGSKVINKKTKIAGQKL